MQRQDEFLRDLSKIAESHINSLTAFKGLGEIIDAIERRLPRLKPVAYENYDLSTGLSGGGIRHICGDKASIARVQLAMHNEAAFKPYVMMHRELQERLARITAVLDA